MARQTASSNEKLQEALQLLNDAAKDKREELKTLVGSKYGDLKGAILGAEDKVAERVGEAAQRLREARTAGQERIRDASVAVDKRVHEEPWKALGIAAGVGLLIGFIMGRK